MSWARIDDQMAFHRKVVNAGNGAVGAWIRMVAWCAAHLTDGRVPQSIARLIASQAELDRCVKHGILDVDGNDYLVHDYLDWNPSAESINAQREADRQRKAKIGGWNPNGFRPESATPPNGFTALPSGSDPIPSGSENTIAENPKREAAKRLIAEFNRISGKHARLTDTNIRAFEARLSDTSEQDIAATLAHRHRIWSQGDGSMLQYFVIETLTRPGKFEKYLTECVADRSRPTSSSPARRLIKAVDDPAAVNAPLASDSLFLEPK